MTFIAEYGHAIGGPKVKGIGDAGGLDRPLVARATTKPAKRSARSARWSAGHPNIFPNSWVATGTTQLSLRIPLLAEPDRDLVVQLHPPRQPARSGEPST